MANFKFSPKDLVRRIGQQEIRTVEVIQEMPAGQETLYHIQRGTDVETRELAKESELELVPAGNRAMARPVDARDKHIPKKQE